MPTPECVASKRSEEHAPLRTNTGELERRPRTDLETAPPSAWRFVTPIALVVLILLAFIPALDAGLVAWDDDDLLVYTTTYRSLSLDSLRWMFTTSFAGHFQPLTWLSYWLDWSLWHREMFGFHLTSVALHTMTALVFYFVARRLLTGSERETRSGPIVASAGFAAAVFALHPLRVESVAWLAERRDVLSALFFVLAVWCHIRFAVASGRRPIDRDSTRAVVEQSPVSGATGTARRRAFYIATIACCVLSLLSKATAVTLPLVLLVLDGFPLRRLRRGATVRGLIVEKTPLFILAGVAGWRAIVAQQQTGAFYGLAQHGVAARFAQACHGLVFYASKTLWPGNLGPLYEIPTPEVLFGSTLWLSVAIILGTAAAAVALRRRAPGLMAALAVYVVVLFPLLGLLQSGPQFVADRYSYLACTGFALLAGAILLRVLRSESWGWRSPRRSLVALVSVGLVGFCTRATFAQADYWLSPYTLWRHGVQVSPDSAIAQTNFADALAELGLRDAAQRHYRRALQLNPNDAVALQHWGDLQRRSGSARTASALYVRALAIDPDRLNACLSLAQMFLRTGHPQRAVTVLEDGARRHPESLRLLAQLATVLATHRDGTVRDPGRAVRLALRLADAAPAPDAGRLLILASAYASASRFAEAETVARRALVLAEADRDDRLAAELRRRIELFAAGKPYLDGN